MVKNNSECLPRRVILSLLCASGVVILYMSRTNLSISIVEMVQTVTSDTVDAELPRVPFCLRDNNSTFVLPDEILFNNSFNNESNIWHRNPYEDTFRIKLSSTQRGLILSAFYYSYGFSGIIGGRLSEKYGTKKVFGAAVLIDAIGNFLIPVATKTNYILLIVIRLAMGLGQGACFPALHSLVSVWIPHNEESRFIGFVYAANSFGSIFTLTACGVIISDLGWEAVFYICGAICLLWLLLWFTFMHDTPEKHPGISAREKNFILCERKRAHKSSEPIKTPWKKLFVSMPMWAININHAGNMFVLGFMVTQLPIYMSSIIGVNIKKNGVLSSIPFLARFIGSTGFSWLSNYMINKTDWTPKTWKRIITVIGNGIGGITILLVGYVGCNAYAALTLFSIGMALNGVNSSGYLCNYLELTPNFAGTALGISNTFAFLYTTVAPIIVGALTPEETISEWISVFWVVFASLIIPGVFYYAFVSCDIQPWNNGSDEGCRTECTDGEKMLNLKQFPSNENVEIMKKENIYQ